VNISIGFAQEYRAEKTMDSLRQLSSPTGAVLRDSEIASVPSVTIVPGDVVSLKTGDVIPADVRLYESMNFETDEALLTGESLPVAKRADKTYHAEVGVGDRLNMAYSSSTVTRGRAMGIVVAVGMNTEIGNIAETLRPPGRRQ
jgi:Na+-exporting ATPase